MPNSLKAELKKLKLLQAQWVDASVRYHRAKTVKRYQLFVIADITKPAINRAKEAQKKLRKQIIRCKARIAALKKQIDRTANARNPNT
jgi:hypothetical protein